MNVTHLGDALDFWKGALIGMLGQHLRNVHVLPMFTDKNVASTWTKDRLRTYARLLHIDSRRVLHSRRRFTTKHRASYFKDLEVALEDDIFVDPDTGVEPVSGGDDRHILLSELAQLMPSKSKRVVLVYQHSSRSKDWVKECLNRVVQYSELTGCHAFAYDAGSVAMLFLSRDSRRLRLLRAALTDLNLLVVT